MSTVLDIALWLVILAVVGLLAVNVLVILWGLKRELLLLAVAAVLIAAVTFGVAVGAGFLADNVPLVGGVIALVVILALLWFLARGNGPPDAGFTGGLG